MSVFQTTEYSEFQSTVDNLLNQHIADERIVTQMKQPSYTRVFSPLRANAIKWLPISKKDVVLEIGADYGELSGYLCSCSEVVYAFERDVCKAELIKKRYSLYSNLHVYSKDIASCLEAASVAGITYIIVHELALAFENRESLQEMLEYVHKHFANACLVMMCVNRFAMKYLAGAKSQSFEHYEPLFSDEKGTFFSKQGAQKFLYSLGYNAIRFFYPYPDELFPKTIFSDEFLPESGMISPYDCTWDDHFSRNFNECEALNTCVKEGIFSWFCNGFVIVSASKEENLPQLPELVRFSNERASYFSIQTHIENGFVKKKPDTTFARGHILRTAKYGNLLKKQYEVANLKPVIAQREGYDIIYPYMEGITLKRVIQEAYDCQDNKAFDKLIEEYINRIKQTHSNGYFSLSADFLRVFGEVKVLPELRSGTYNNIDLVFDNIILGENDNWHVIDYEWTFDFPIPVMFILFRALFYFFNEQKECEQKYAWRMKAMKHIGITEEVENLFMTMENNFQKYIVNGITPLRELPQL